MMSDDEMDMRPKPERVEPVADADLRTTQSGEIK
jgi:hypothetical protein